MAWWSKESDKINEKIQNKIDEIQKCKEINIKINNVGNLLKNVPDKLNVAYNEFYGGGYLDNNKSIDVNIFGKSRINLLKQDVIDIQERILSFKIKVNQLILKKESELRILEQQYTNELNREKAEKNS